MGPDQNLRYRLCSAATAQKGIHTRADTGRAEIRVLIHLNAARQLPRVKKQTPIIHTDTPLLQSIIEELDRELVRLQSLRSIVASLNRTPKAVARLTSSLLAVTSHEQSIAIPVEQPKPLRCRRAVAGKPRERPARKPSVVSEPRAFATSIPSGPVVFNPRQLAEEKAKREGSKRLRATTEPV